jgi:DNA uptake protein ComE-like DNA-binding protein
MKGHIALFLTGVGVAVAGAFVYDRYRAGDLDVSKTAEHVREVTRDLSQRAAEMKDQVQDKMQQVSSVASLGLVDLNEGSREDLRRLGIDDDAVLDRIVENRPYRNKMDLLSRMIVPEDVYETIKHGIEVRRRDEGVKVA